MKRHFSTRSRAGIMLMLLALGGASQGIGIAHAASPTVDVDFKGTLVTNCVINGGQKTTVDFGNVDIGSIDGSGYDKQSIPLNFSAGCTAKSVTMTLTSPNNVAPWNSNAVLMDKKTSLGVIVSDNQGMVLTPNKGVGTNNPTKEQLVAVLVAKKDDLPNAGAFTGSVTIKMDFQ